MAKATRKNALGTGLSRLINEEKNKKAPIKEIDGYILNLENTFLKEQNLSLTEQLKDCREQLTSMQKTVMTTLEMHEKLIEINKTLSAKIFVDVSTKAKETEWKK